MFKYFSLFIVISISPLASATWIYGMDVNSIQSLGNGGFIVYGPPGAAQGCPEGGKRFHVESGSNGQTPEGVKSALSIALVAFSSGKKVTLAYDQNSPNCHISTILVAN